MMLYSYSVRYFHCVVSHVPDVQTRHTSIALSLTSPLLSIFLRIFFAHKLSLSKDSHFFPSSPSHHPSLGHISCKLSFNHAIKAAIFSNTSPNLLSDTFYSIFFVSRFFRGTSSFGKPTHALSVVDYEWSGNLPFASFKKSQKLTFCEMQIGYWFLSCAGPPITQSVCHFTYSFINFSFSSNLIDHEHCKYLLKQVLGFWGILSKEEN